MPNTAGVVARKGTLATESAPTTQRLLDLGAIPLGVTNTSELTMWIESVNRVYGRTNNAYDAGRTAGGSSGGEGAVVGSGGAPIGLGSDIGGSIRLPAFFNGVFGHKCTAHLVPNSGQWPEAVGEPTRMLAVGPIVRRAEDLMPVLRAIAGPDGIDPDTREVELGDPADVELSGLPVIIGQDITPPKIARELLDVRERAAGALAAAGASVRTESLRSIRQGDGVLPGHAGLGRGRGGLDPGGRHARHPCAAAARSSATPSAAAATTPWRWPSCWPSSAWATACPTPATRRRSRPAARWRARSRT